MSLNWQWKNVIGEIEKNGNERIFIYEGNAFLIFIWENEKEYSLANFASDKRHCENCLGLHPKEFEGMKYWYENKTYILSAGSKNAMKFVELLAKAKIKCTVKIVEKYESDLHKKIHNNYNLKD